MLTEVKGLVIRETNINESDKLLNIFTDNGVVAAVAKGVRCMKSKNMAACQVFCYASYVLYSKGGYYWIKEVSLIDNFFNIRLSLEKTAVASYICEVVDFTATAEPSDEFLSLVLNSLYALSVDKYPVNKVKAVFESRLAAILGFMPDIDFCRSCKKKKAMYTLDILNGSIICSECKNNHSLDYFNEEENLSEHCLPVINITEGARAGMWYVMHCPLKDVLSFSLSDEDMAVFVKASENYFLNHVDHIFKTLDFYYELINK